MSNEISIDYAEKNIRFFNFLIDKFCLWLLWIIHVLFFEDTIQLITGDDSLLNNILYLIGFYLFYYLIFESLFGRTIGKFLTGTKVIDYNGNKPNFKRIFIRSFCRLIPFDAISFLISDEGWHDTISKTSVINV